MIIIVKPGSQAAHDGKGCNGKNTNKNIFGRLSRSKKPSRAGNHNHGKQKQRGQGTAQNPKQPATDGQNRCVSFHICAAMAPDNGQRCAEISISDAAIDLLCLVFHTVHDKMRIHTFPGNYEILLLARAQASNASVNSRGLVTGPSGTKVNSSLCWAWTMRL